ncbi:MAG: SDR family NAD(P)-dependent oxidoreductase [Gammaproteobacteria bacterium]
MLLENKNILITGATDGIGAQISKLYSSHGANIILLGRNEEKLNKIYDDIIENTDTKPLILEYDLNQISDNGAKEIANAISDEYGVLHGLIHNAAELGKLTSLENYSLDDWDKLMRVNLTAPFLLTKYLLPSLKEADNGRVILTSSGVAHKGRAFWGAYSISKAALKTMQEIFSEEFEESSSIKFFSFDPGATRTKMRSAAYPAEDPNNLKSAEDLNDYYLWFFSEQSNQKEINFISFGDSL